MMIMVKTEDTEAMKSKPSKTDLAMIHHHCGWHEAEILSSERCGCFDCLSLFPPSAITEWIDESADGPRGPGKTAVCPHCGMDTVLPQHTAYTLSPALLTQMQRHYCGE